MLHTKSFNECQKPHGNNKINLIHFYPDLWVPGSGQNLHLTMSFHNYSQMGQVRGFAPIGLRPIGARPRRACWPIASVRIMSSGLRLGEVSCFRVLNLATRRHKKEEVDELVASGDQRIRGFNQVSILLLHQMLAEPAESSSSHF